MTRAPRSASWRVQNGAAMACSSVRTVMPWRGFMSVVHLLECCSAGWRRRADRVGAFDKLSPNGLWFVRAEGFDKLSPNGFWFVSAQGFDKLSPNGCCD